MRVVLISQNYHPMLGGIETQVRMFAAELARRGHAAEVVAANFRPLRLPRRLAGRLAVLSDSLLIPRPDAAGRPEGDFDGSVRVHTLTPGRLDRVRMLPIAARAIPRLQRYAYQPLYEFGYHWYRRVFGPRLRQILRGADVAHGFCGGYLGWAAQEAAAAVGVPYVCTPYVHPHQWGDDRANVAYYHRSDTVMALSGTDRDYLITLGVPADRVRLQGVVPLLPPSTDPSGFRRRHGIEPTDPLVLYVGRMMPQKGAQAVLAAAPLVWREAPRARFTFAGPHDAAAGSERWFAGADARVTYLGRVTDQEKADALAAADVFCMPSTSEILPAVYLEAWAYGKPVVGGQAHGLPELIEGNGAGVTVEQTGPAVAAALSALLADPDRRVELGGRGRALVERRYSTGAVVGTLESLYQGLVARQGSRAV
ncbi:MAG TPA: glycosyltransferase family 4 protein, partial [Humisphaera sp.]